jgi:hypothetical protein
MSKSLTGCCRHPGHDLQEQRSTNEFHEQPLEKRQLMKRPVWPVDGSAWIIMEKLVEEMIGLAKTEHGEV